MADVSIEALKAALVKQGFDVNSEKFVMALRAAENPAGCEWCGARTKMAVEDPKKKNSLVLACCGRKAGV